MTQTDEVRLPPVSMREPENLQTAWTKDFHNPAYEWRRYFSEYFGTFLLVLVAAGAGVVDARTHKVPLDAAVVAPGLMVMAVIYFMGTVSGAHLNPAVTVGFALRRNFPWKRVPGYLVSQLAGSLTASAVLLALFGNVGKLGATLPGAGISTSTAVVIEGLLTMGLVSVILGTASGARNVGPNAALAVGAYIALAGLWAAPVSGASMNPFRSLGPVLVGGAYRDWWIYLVGPLVGSALAVGLASILRGRPTKAGAEAAQGTLPG